MSEQQPIEIQCLFGGKQYKTAVWLTETARDTIKGDQDAQPFLKKLHYLAQAGFLQFEGAEGSLVRHEDGRAYRVRCSTSSLFRLIGLYCGSRKLNFYGIEGMRKRGQNYTNDQWRSIKAVGLLDPDKHLVRKANAT